MDKVDDYNSDYFFEKHSYHSSFNFYYESRLNVVKFCYDSNNNNLMNYPLDLNERKEFLQLLKETNEEIEKCLRIDKHQRLRSYSADGRDNKNLKK